MPQLTRVGAAEARSPDTSGDVNVRQSSRCDGSGGDEMTGSRRRRSRQTTAVASIRSNTIVLSLNVFNIKRTQLHNILVVQL